MYNENDQLLQLTTAAAAADEEKTASATHCDLKSHTSASASAAASELHVAVK